MTHIITMTYPPTDAAKKMYSEFKKEGQNLCLMNAGSLREEADKDDWIKDNIIFEDALPDNRAKMNHHWCEMTSIYAVWRNMLDKMDDGDYIQNSHYRRMLRLPPNIEKGVIYIGTPHPMLFNTDGKTIRTSIEGGMRICHPPQSWETMEHLMYDELNWHDIHIWNEWKSLDAMPAPNQLFAMPVGVFRSYCNWIFPLLERIERAIPFGDEGYQTAYQRRATGFCAERLFSFWCYIRSAQGEPFLFCPINTYEEFKPFTDKEEREMKI